MPGIPLRRPPSWRDQMTDLLANPQQQGSQGPLAPSPAPAPGAGSPASGPLAPSPGTQSLNDAGGTGELPAGSENPNAPPAPPTPPPPAPGPQFPGTVSPQAPRGWDAGKWGDTQHQTIKYTVGRMISKYGFTPQGLQAAAPELATLGVTVVGKDSIRLPDGQVVDVVTNASSGDPSQMGSWWSLDAGAPNAAGGGAGDQGAAASQGLLAWLTQQLMGRQGPGTQGPSTGQPGMPSLLSGLFSQPSSVADPNRMPGPLIDEPGTPSPAPPGPDRIPGPMIDEPGTPGPGQPPPDPNTPEGLRRLLETQLAEFIRRNSADVNASEIHGSAPAQAAQLEGQRQADYLRSAMAERYGAEGLGNVEGGGGSGAFDASMLGIGQQRGAQQAMFEGQLAERMLNDRQTRLQSALQLGAGYLNDQQRLQLQGELQRVNQALEMARLLLSNQQFYDDLGYRIGSREADLNQGASGGYG